MKNICELFSLLVKKMGAQENDALSQLSLPPGFRFYPTDEELMVDYLCRKVAGYDFPLRIIGDIDLYKFNPWELPSKALFGEKEWYFFSPRDRKYPNGSRPNRVAGSGYWKATGTDKIITTEGRKVGIKKALVFYVGRAPKGSKTNWIMHEYRLLESQRQTGSSKLDDWVLCRIYKKNSSVERADLGTSRTECSHGSSSNSSQYDDMMDSLPALDDQFINLPKTNPLNFNDRVNFQSPDNNSINNFSWTTLTGFTNSPQETLTGFTNSPREQFHATQVIPMQVENQGVINNINNNNQYCQNNMFVPARYGSTEQEVQSGLRSQQVDRSGFLNPNGYDHGDGYGYRFGYQQGMVQSVDPYGIRYPTTTQPGNSS